MISPSTPSSRCRAPRPSRAASSPRAVENELLLRPIGRTVYVMPPYVLDEEEIVGLAARTRTVFESVIAADDGPDRQSTASWPRWMRKA
jgi:adenosylmethionine-8-amino-7-oxononanoate aminotransferase